jgi:hypothetical protein
MKPKRNLIHICLLSAGLFQPLISGAQPVTQVAAGDFHSLFLKCDGSLWVMGDNRYFSGDSREQYMSTHDITASTIADSSVVGRAFVLFWPLGRARWLSVPDMFDTVR